MNRTMLAFITATLLVAGCGDKPATGSLADVGAHPSLGGSSQVYYQAFSNGGNPTGNPATECLQDGVNGTAPIPGQSPLQPCKRPYTIVRANFTGLPEPGSLAYKLYLAGGTGGEQEVGDVLYSPVATTLEKVFPVDYSGKFERLELRLTGLVVATAPSTGTSTFTPLAAPTVSATFTGNEITVDVAGLPENATYVGRLYTTEGVATKTAQETFPITNGANKFTAKTPVGDYAEFHIHAGDSAFTLYKATIHKDGA